MSSSPLGSSSHDEVESVSDLTGPSVGSQVTCHPPTGEPIASLKGGARIGGMAVSHPFAVLDLHESALVVRSPQNLFSPVSIRRDAVGSLRVTRRPVGAALKLRDENGCAYDVVFESFSSDQLRGALASAGWLVLLE